MAAGVASDSAQGQVTTSTARVASKARDGSNHSHSPATSSDSARIEPTNQAAARSAASATRGRSRLRALDQRNHRGQRRTARIAAGAQRDRRSQVHGAAEQRIAGGVGDRHRLAAHQRLVDQRRAFPELAVHGDHGAGGDQHASPRRMSMQRDALAAAIGLDARRAGREAARQRLAGVEAAAPHARLDVAADQQEEDEHRHGVEIHLPAGRAACCRRWRRRRAPARPRPAHPCRGCGAAGRSTRRAGTARRSTAAPAR